MDEMILGIIPNAISKKGWFKQQTWNLIFTNHRMIGALLTEALIKAAANAAHQAAQTQGTGALKRMWSMATAGVNLNTKYLSMPVDQILAENPENFSVELSQIEWVKINSGLWNEQNQKPDTLTIKTFSEKMELQLGFGSATAKQATDLLRPILGDRVK